MRILLAEDEKSLSKALKVILEKNNYSVDAVYDGDSAYSYLHVTNYDAAILDIMMPGMDGISVLKKIRKEGNPVPVIMLTAKSEIDSKIEGLDSGANDYLTKPFNTRELLARIRAMTRINSVQNDSLLKTGNITLNRRTFELKSDLSDQVVLLSGKEYQMLELLMINEGIPISTEKFMDKIWGLDSDAEQNVVWSFLSYLRKKLQSINANVEIKVSRGVGYKLELKNDSETKA